MADVLAALPEAPDWDADEAPNGWASGLTGPVLILLALPLALMLFDRNWLYPRPDTVDPWMYISYFLDARFQLGAFPHAYHGTRLPIFLPGMLVAKFLPPDRAIIVVHLLFYYLSVFSLYFILRAFLDARTALLATVLAGGNAMFLSTIGLTHPDGYGNAYALLTALLLTRAAVGRFWRLPLFCAGGTAALYLYTNLAYLPLAILFPWLLVTLPRDKRAKSAFLGLLYAVLGIALMSVALCLINRRLCGRTLFFWPWIESMLWMLPHTSVCTSGDRTWVSHAGWLVLPVLAVVATVAGWRTGSIQYHERSTAVRSLVGSFLLVGFVMLGFEAIRFVHFLQFSFYASLMLPGLFLATGGLLALVVPRWSAGTYRLALAFAFVLGACTVIPLNGSVLRGTNVWLLPLLLAGGALVLMAIPRLFVRHVPALAVGLFGVVNIVIGSNYDRFVTACPLERKHVPAQEWVGTWEDPLKGRAYARPVLTRRQAVLIVADAFRALVKHDANRCLRLWYPTDDEYGSLYSALAATYMWDQRMVSPYFPRLENVFHDPIETREMFHGPLEVYGAARVAVLAHQDRAVLDEATAALKKFHLEPAVVHEQTFEARGIPVRLTILELTRVVPCSRAAVDKE